MLMRVLAELSKCWDERERALGTLRTLPTRWGPMGRRRCDVAELLG